MQPFNKTTWAPSTCYTCSGALSTFIIRDMSLGRCHYCRRLRCLLIYTPHIHYEKIYEVPGEDLRRMMLEINAFMWDYLGTQDYQIQNNHGSYSSHKHLHIKIACDEVVLAAKRDEHFRRQGLTVGIPLPRPIPATGLNLENDRRPFTHFPRTLHRRSTRADNPSWRRAGPHSPTYAMSEPEPESEPEAESELEGSRGRWRRQEKGGMRCVVPQTTQSESPP